MHNWLLPEYIEDILPPEAWQVERMRRELLDGFRASGYRLVIPPLLEYTQSLLTGTASDLDLRTFKLIDQLSGRLMGLRADITPQAARIDAHLLNVQGIDRLCYAGSVLHATPAGLGRTREPLQIGAELFGHKGYESDLEIQQLMLQALKQAGIEHTHLDVGHVSIFRSLVQRAHIDSETESAMFVALQNKDDSTLQQLTSGLEVSLRDSMLQLPHLYGSRKILSEARRVLPDWGEIRVALDELEHISEPLAKDVDNLCFDLSDLRGYRYHNGMVFTAYTLGRTTAIAQGGRYDGAGQAFGRARAATGFSMDLRELIKSRPPQADTRAILAPYGEDPALHHKITALRSQGEIVIVELPGTEEARSELHCDRILVLQNGAWVVSTL